MGPKGKRPEDVATLVVFCSDGHWADAFDTFCRNSLHLRGCDRYVVPGGPACLALRASNLARDHLTFLVRAHSTAHIVLLGHSGCAVYGHVLNSDAESCLPAQREDLRTATALLRGWFPGVRVDAYLLTSQSNRPASEKIDFE